MVDITKLDSFVGSSPNPAWLANSTGDCLYANPALERLTGLKPDQIDHADWRNFLLEEDRAAATAAWERSLVSGTPYRTRVRMRGFDGTPATVEIIAFGHKVNDEAELWLFTGLRVHSGLQQQATLEAQLQATLNVIPAYTWYALPSGALTFVNERQANYLGLPKDHPLRVGIDVGAEWDSHLTFVHPDDYSEMRRAWSHCVRTGSPGELSFRARDGKGEYRWFLSRAEPLLASDGTLLYWIGISLDIDDAKRAEHRLEEAQRITHVGYWEWDVLTGRVNWSDETYRIYGLRPQERPMDLDTVREKIHPEDWQRGMEEALGSGDSFNAECRVFRPTGEVRIAHFQGDVKRDASGRPYRIFGTVQDITDRKRAEEALQQSQFYLAEGQRLAKTGSWAFNAAGFEYWSSELFRIYGLDPRGKPPTAEEYLALVHPEDREFMAQGIQKMLVDHLSFDFTKRIVRPDGEIRRIRCVGVPVTQEGTFQGFLGTGIDVTEQERLTEELRLSEHYLREGERLAHMGSWAFNPSGYFDHWSHELFQIYGIDPAKEAPSLENYLACVHPQDREFMASLMQRVVADASGCDVTKRIVRPDGEVRYVRSVGAPVVENGTLKRIVGTAIDVTEHELLTQKLRRDEAYLSEAQRLSHTGSFGWRPDTGEIVWSDETYRIFEYPRAVTPTMDLIMQRIHPEDRADFQEVVHQASVTGTDFEHTYRLLLPGGRVKHFHALAHAQQDESGNVEFLGAGTDITERKRAEQTLRESEAYLAEAQRLSQTGSWAWNPASGDIRYWSEECYRVLGFDPHEPPPRFETFFQRIHRDDQAHIRERIEKSIRDKEDFELDYRIVHPDNRVRDIHVLGRAVLDRSGDLGEFVGTVIDVTERKRAEDELRRSEAELRQVLNLAPQIVAVFGARRERLYANRVLLDYLGRTNEEWLQPGQPGTDIHPDDIERVNDAFDRALASGSAFEVEMRLRKDDGSYRWFFGRYNPLRDDKGQITRWYAAATDIDERKRAEDKLLLENTALREEIDQTSMFEEIVGTSPALQTVLSRISKVAPSDSTVLITGETGTGKELVARAIHHRSRRRSRPFVSVNCAAVPRDLIASELFGHEKGAFTGALQRRLGKFEQAEGGTIFLDEVGELPAETQVALLRVLQEHELERVGGNQAIRTDVRVISATNRDLQAAIASGVFRSDLFYRLNVFPIEVPPLRARKDDITMLVEYFIHRYARQAGKKIKNVDKKTLELVQAYPWPGNIRELQNVIERSVILCETEIFSVDESWLSRALPSPLEESPTLSKKPTLHEREIIEAALAEAKGRVSGPSGAAAKLGIPSTTLESKIKSLKINKHHFKAS